ncbi:sugar phosphate isomerase/epimerase [Blastopirellula sp. J2-11]|uniref:sugar phosphate isomerase/epimerase family protein n=1 Tax=Blastopirellula sp. J2-11 TaxID=2943192 RepID=UPI0021C8BD20|nr:sugar phosphate isomerase/epimerase [Blastopirellula sp. J2-11]UUO08302.1 sugar phosphate isomerase/epimerase [Blastopirellula sp. J2-11]
MNELPQVLLSGFADEAANDKLAVQQFSAFAALGLEYYSLRFIDVGNGIKNVMQLNKSEISKVRKMEGEYGLNVASIGSPIGKVKLVDSDDGSKNKFVKFDKYLATDVQKACDLAHAFETKLIRGFSFYHPIGSDPYDHIPQAVDQLGQIAEMCHRSDLTFGLEVEANLIGQTGDILAEIHKKVNHPAMMLIFDAGNLVCQGYTPDEVYQQYVKMKPGLGWMHIKDYKVTKPITEKGHIDEDALKNFVPSDLGDSAHERILRDFGAMIPKLEKKLQKRGIPGVFLDLEPHVKGGGQFGGFSGPDGMGVALRGLCRTLDFAGVDYHLRDFDDICAARGF